MTQPDHGSFTFAAERFARRLMTATPEQREAMIAAIASCGTDTTRARAVLSAVEQSEQLLQSVFEKAGGDDGAA